MGPYRRLIGISVSTVGPCFARNRYHSIHRHIPKGIGSTFGNLFPVWLPDGSAVSSTHPFLINETVWLVIRVFCLISDIEWYGLCATMSVMIVSHLSLILSVLRHWRTSVVIRALLHWVYNFPGQTINCLCLSRIYKSFAYIDQFAYIDSTVGFKASSCCHKGR